MIPRIVEEVQQYPFDSAFVDEYHVVVVEIGDDENVPISVTGSDSLDERSEMDFLELVLSRSGIEATQLEEIQNRSVESPNLGGDDVECLPVAVRQFIGSCLQDVDRSAEGGDR